jgi:Uma2 family endonuclease
MRYETGVFRRDDDYRVPDLSFFPAERADLIATEGLRGALAVLEIRSPDDETYKKFGFYASLGIREVIVIHRDTRAVEVYRLVEQTYLATAADERGRYHAATIDVRFSTVAGPFLRVEHAGATREI